MRAQKLSGTLLMWMFLNDAMIPDELTPGMKAIFAIDEVMFGQWRLAGWLWCSFCMHLVSIQ